MRPTPVSAYRDAFPPGEWESPSPFVAGCISIATILQAATLDRSGATGAVDRAAHLAGELLPASVLRYGCRYEPIGVSTPVSALRTLVEHLEQRERYFVALAGHILDSLALLYPPDEIEGIRVLASRLRNASLRGLDDLRMERSRRLVEIGRKLHNEEVLFRGWGGIGGYAQIRGNMPYVRRALAREAKHAERVNDPRMQSIGMASRALAKGLSDDLAGCIELYWGALSLADHPELRFLFLGNVAHALYLSGHFRASRAARALVLRARPDVNTVFINLGGYAVACAGLRDVTGAAWASNEALRLSKLRGAARGAAQGLIGCADACAELGLLGLGKELRDAGLRIAEALGYHDLRFRTQPAVAPSPVRRDTLFRGAAEAAIASIVEQAPDGVPDDFTLVPG